MSYKEGAKSTMRTYLDAAHKTGKTETLWLGLATVSMELLGALADELHELNERLENGETVQTGSDQTGT